MNEVEDRLEKLDNLIKVQADEGNWNYSPYMHGLLIGMLVAKSVFTDEQPEYPDAPEHWIEDFETMDKLNKSGTTIEVTENES